MPARRVSPTRASRWCAPPWKPASRSPLYPDPARSSWRWCCPAYRYILLPSAASRRANRGARCRFFAVDQDSPHTLIFYESPYRLAAFLEDALAVYGDRPAAVANDLTKKFEEVRRGTLSELAAHYASLEKVLGEYTVVIAGKED